MEERAHPRVAVRGNCVKRKALDTLRGNMRCAKTERRRMIPQIVQSVGQNHVRVKPNLATCRSAQSQRIIASGLLANSQQKVHWSKRPRSLKARLKVLDHMLHSDEPVKRRVRVRRRAAKVVSLEHQSHGLLRVLLRGSLREAARARGGSRGIVAPHGVLHEQLSGARI